MRRPFQPFAIAFYCISLLCDALFSLVEGDPLPSALHCDVLLSRSSREVDEGLPLPLRRAFKPVVEVDERSPVPIEL